MLKINNASHIELHSSLRQNFHSRIKSQDVTIKQSLPMENKIQRKKSQSKDFQIKIEEFKDENFKKQENHSSSPVNCKRTTLASHLKIEDFNRANRSEMRLSQVSQGIRRISSVRIARTATYGGSPARRNNLICLNRNSNYLNLNKGKDQLKVFHAKKLSKIIKETCGKEQSEDSDEFKSLSSFSNMSSPRINRRTSSKIL